METPIRFLQIFLGVQAVCIDGVTDSRRVDTCLESSDGIVGVTSLRTHA